MQQRIIGLVLLVIGVICLVVLLKQLQSFVSEPEHERHVETAAFLGH